MSLIFKCILTTSFGIVILLLSESASYSSPQTDNRGFPAQHAHAPSLGTPRPNAVVGAPAGHNRQQFIHQPENRNNNHFHHNNSTVVVPYFYDFTTPDYYVTQPEDDNSFNYSTTTEETPNDNDTIQPPTSFNFPDGQWIASSDGSVPNQALVYQTQNGQPTYYCRVLYQNQYAYGVLTPNEGCYITDQSNVIRFNTYDVLTAN